MTNRSTGTATAPGVVTMGMGVSRTGLGVSSIRHQVHASMGVATTVEKRPAPLKNARCSIEGMRSKASANGGAATRMERLKPLQITVRAIHSQRGTRGRNTTPASAYMDAVQGSARPFILP